MYTFLKSKNAEYERAVAENGPDYCYSHEYVCVTRIPHGNVRGLSCLVSTQDYDEFLRLYDDRLSRGDSNMSLNECMSASSPSLRVSLCLDFDCQSKRVPVYDADEDFPRVLRVVEARVRRRLCLLNDDEWNFADAVFLEKKGSPVIVRREDGGGIRYKKGFHVFYPHVRLLYEDYRELFKTVLADVPHLDASCTSWLLLGSTKTGTSDCYRPTVSSSPLPPSTASVYSHYHSSARGRVEPRYTIAGENVLRSEPRPLNGKGVGEKKIRELLSELPDEYFSAYATWRNVCMVIAKETDCTGYATFEMLSERCPAKFSREKCRATWDSVCANVHGLDIDVSSVYKWLAVERYRVTAETCEIDISPSPVSQSEVFFPILVRKNETCEKFKAVVLSPPPCDPDPYVITAVFDDEEEDFYRIPLK